MLLENALAQGLPGGLIGQNEGIDDDANLAQWRGRLLTSLENLDFQKIRADILPYLERKEEADMVERDGLRRLLESL